MIAMMLRVAVIAIALCGCRDERLEQVKLVRERVCACRTIACGESTVKELPPVTNPSAREQKLAAEMMTCLSKLYLAPPDKAPAPELGEELTRPDGGIQIHLDKR
jgi:hypothetical protein